MLQGVSILHKARILSQSYYKGQRYRCQAEHNMTGMILEKATGLNFEYKREMLLYTSTSACEMAENDIAKLLDCTLKCQIMQY